MIIEELYRDLIPQNYSFPKAFTSLIACENIDIEPWRFFTDASEDLQRFVKVFREKYPENKLIPFAFIHDITGFYNDAWPVVASFDLMDDSIVRLYDFAEPQNSPWKNLSYVTFEDWLVMAKKESEQYKDELAELE